MLIIFVVGILQYNHMILLRWSPLNFGTGLSIFFKEQYFKEQYYRTNSEGGKKTFAINRCSKSNKGQSMTPAQFCQPNVLPLLNNFLSNRIQRVRIKMPKCTISVDSNGFSSFIYV